MLALCWYYVYMKRLIDLPDELDEALKARAKQDDRSVAATIRVALGWYLASLKDEEPA